MRGMHWNLPITHGALRCTARGRGLLHAAAQAAAEAERLATPQAAVHSPIVICVMMANTKDSTYVVAPYTQPG